ncbi:glycosyltransferase family 4 protein [Streptomyces sp. MNU89]|uniref:glycosyltransferase family 4 protein n=1 Tax=Streptomyces sp. MNU89 TaxID=2560025 RepID=UPI001E52D225|nr:glycosyltransferase family 4 protein [Streptomyces sp. MNU89]MCC9740167.1 glycosyltransferase family 4 protein [Streptomyces sp. MNU89]
MTGQRYRILAVCTRSGMGKGGIPVFNEQIAVALGREHEVTVLTGRSDTAPHEGVRVLTMPDPPKGVEEEDWLKQQVAQDPRIFGLPDPREQSFDLIIGHSRFSGPAAVVLRDAWFTDARVAHFLHTSPERLAEVKYELDPERARTKALTDSAIERDVMARADIVVGVGPLLTEEAKRLASTGPHVPDAHELIPGTKIEELVQHTASSGRLNVLAMGRAGDPLKGFESAAEAVALLNEWGHEVHLTIRGAPPEEIEDVRAELREIGGDHVAVELFTKDAAELQNAVGQADLVIMPSKHEGFGLVATEALGHGIPVLVNEESGAAKFLGDERRFGPELGKSCIVPEPADAEDRPLEWAAAIQRVQAELPERREQARQLREVLRSYSWDHAGKALVEAAMRVPEDRTARAAATRDVQQKVVPGATTQGPDGALVTLDPGGSGVGSAGPGGSGPDVPQQAAAAARARAPGPQTRLAKAAGLTSQGRRTTGTAGAADQQKARPGPAPGQGQGQGQGIAQPARPQMPGLPKQPGAPGPGAPGPGDSRKR